ncbi:MAG: 23S rRNA (adenine(2030)-N(6))-methyltransferase RlmJ [Alphaproteobacteria bacterium]|nr:23S rRNA (adenine(2030)-N(6))-methyltransferase RlmJ [Alphaproteobacteria bacterium]MCD8571721.1 23S rRNA (adenine(2030)-N(6))-methyltransferase RlmJ [Alphaproteobacteria bacterium]
MLSYQHIYHAGNAADVQKHLWLIRVLTALKKTKEKLFWLDTHAGRGLYDLSSPEAQKLGEYRDGFLSFREKTEGRKNAPPEVEKYLKLIDKVNKKRKGFYPGSAYIAAKILEPGDQITLCEMHKGEIEFLKKSMQTFSFAKVLKEDGYDVLSTLLPPPQKQGGVLIDPSYEVKTEYRQVLDAVRAAHAAWPNGVFLIWYPILKAGNHISMVAGLKTLKNNGTSVIVDEQLFRDPASEGKGMAGTGMVVINAPAAAG